MVRIDMWLQLWYLESPGTHVLRLTNSWLLIFKFLRPLSSLPGWQTEGNNIRSLRIIEVKIHVIPLEDPFPTNLFETGLIAACLLRAPVIVSTGRVWVCLDFIDGTVYRGGMFGSRFANCWGRNAMHNERKCLSLLFEQLRSVDHLGDWIGRHQWVEMSYSIFFLCLLILDNLIHASG